MLELESRVSLVDFDRTTFARAHFESLHVVILAQRRRESLSPPT